MSELHPRSSFGGATEESESDGGGSKKALLGVAALGADCRCRILGMDSLQGKFFSPASGCDCTSDRNSSCKRSADSGKCRLNEAVSGLAT